MIRVAARYKTAGVDRGSKMFGKPCLRILSEPRLHHHHHHLFVAKGRRLHIVWPFVSATLRSCTRLHITRLFIGASQRFRNRIRKSSQNRKNRGERARRRQRIKYTDNLREATRTKDNIERKARNREEWKSMVADVAIGPYMAHEEDFPTS